MFLLTLLQAVDTDLGRVDHSSFSDQTLMEMLFEGFDGDTRKRCQDAEGVYLDVCKWKSVECNTEERVITITHAQWKSGSL